jgi:hypothetical protein
MSNPIALSRKRLFFFISALIVCVFIIADAFFLPTKKTIEVVKEIHTGRLGLKSDAPPAFIVATDGTWATVSKQFSDEVRFFEKIIVERSRFSGALISFSLIRDDGTHRFSMDGIDNEIFSFIIWLLIAVTILIFFKPSLVYRKPYVEYAFLGASIYLLFQHLDHLYLFNLYPVTAT